MARLYVFALLTTSVFGCSSIEGTDKTFDDLLGMIQSLQNQIATLQSDNRALKDENKRLSTKLDGVEKWTNERQMDVNSTFFATISATGVQVDSGDAIVFDTAPINPGGHYSTVLGAYTAPANGYYQFSVSKEGNDYYGTFHFLVDEVRYAIKDAWFPNSNADPSGSATINIELTAGQVVRVQNGGSTAVLGTDDSGFIRSWFTGHLLYAF